MPTECMPDALHFHAAQGHDVVARFDGGTLTSDGGAVLLREVERATGIVARFAACFTDYRAPAWIEHSVASLVAQRVYGLALGYEDLNDHDALRADPLFAVLAGAADPTGATRRCARDVGHALAGKSMLNRLELTAATCADTERYKKITVDHDAVDRYFVDLFVQAHATPPTEIVLDLDATDDPVHGAGRPLLSWLLRPLLLLAAVHLRGRASALRAAPPREY